MEAIMRDINVQTRGEADCFTNACARGGHFQGLLKQGETLHIKGLIGHEVVQVFNIYGQQVFCAASPPSGDLGGFNLPAGMYLLKIDGYTQKLVVL